MSYYKKKRKYDLGDKIISSTGGGTSSGSAFDLSGLKNLFANNNADPSTATDPTLKEGFKQGMNEMGNDVLASLPQMGMSVLSQAAGNQQERQAGRYDMNDTGGSSAGAEGAAKILGAVGNKVGFGAEAEGIGKMITGFSTPKEGNKVDEKFGIKYKTYNTSRTGDVVGGAVQAGVGTAMKIFGAGAASGKVAKFVGTGVEAAFDAFGGKKQKAKQRKEEQRVMGVASGLMQDASLNKGFEQYAALMPKYDKYSNIRYARNGGTIYPFKRSVVASYKFGGAVVLGGQLHEAGSKEHGKGNPIYQNGQKVAETEREELLLNKAQTGALEHHIGLFDNTGDSKHLDQLGKIITHIVRNETIDFSGKFPDMASSLFSKPLKKQEGGMIQINGKSGEEEAVLKGGERIFSRPDTRNLIQKAKEPNESVDFNALGKMVYDMIKLQDKRKPEYVSE